jgi:hypothetical protein
MCEMMTIVEHLNVLLGCVLERSIPAVTPVESLEDIVLVVGVIGHKCDLWGLNLGCRVEVVL